MMKFSTGCVPCFWGTTFSCLSSLTAPLLTLLSSELAMASIELWSDRNTKSCGNIMGHHATGQHPIDRLELGIGLLFGVHQAIASAFGAHDIATSRLCEHKRVLIVFRC